jgi:hypothetical protein
MSCQRFTIAAFVAAAALSALADDPDAAPAKVPASKRAIQSQRTDAQKQVSAALRSRRARDLRAAAAIDDALGQGASSFALSSMNAAGTGTGSSAFGSSVSGNGLYPGFGSGLTNFQGVGAAAGGSLGSSGTAATGSTSTAPGANSSGGTGSNSSDPTPPTTYNAKILQFARDHLGQQVGNGECWTLAEDALIYAGAKPADGYVFGTAIPLSSVQPGDILQFEAAIFIGANYWMVVGMPHHTAIVSQIQGNQIQMLNQNVNDVRRVQYSTINLADLRSGKITAYRAIANDSSTGNGESPNGSPTSGTTQPGNSQSGNASKPGNCQSDNSSATTAGTNSSKTTSAAIQRRQSFGR